jgi:hypothetical protein
MMDGPALVLAILLGLTSAALPANGGGGAQIHLVADGSPQPGEPVQVVVRCAGPVGAPSSPVLRIGRLALVDTPDATPAYASPAVVDPVAVPGAYRLVARCGGTWVRTTITIQPAMPGASVHIAADGSPQAGEAVEVVARCPGRLGALHSPVLRIGEPVEVDTPDASPTFVAPAVIDPSAPAGDHPLGGWCDGAMTTTTITVYP